MRWGERISLRTLTWKAKPEIWDEIHSPHHISDRRLCLLCESAQRNPFSSSHLRSQALPSMWECSEKSILLITSQIAAFALHVRALREIHCLKYSCFCLCNDYSQSRKDRCYTFRWRIFFLNLDTFLIHGFAIKILYNKNIMPKE
jgi:hypothetical protein